MERGKHTKPVQTNEQVGKSKRTRRGGERGITALVDRYCKFVPVLLDYTSKRN